MFAGIIIFFGLFHVIMQHSFSNFSFPEMCSCEQEWKNKLKPNGLGEVNAVSLHSTQSTLFWSSKHQQVSIKCLISHGYVYLVEICGGYQNA